MAPLSRAESDAFVDRILESWSTRGFGLFAVEVPGEARFIGFVGLAYHDFPAPFTPCVEVGWRLARAHWRRGYATEAARESLRFGFDELGLDEIVSMTYRGNLRSRAVMERIGMSHDPADDFDHPRVPAGHPVRPHVLYRIQRRAYVPSS